jgi:formamidopyrimidine-DNA glycosylase
MPELPEVETLRAGLEPRIVGRHITAVRLGEFLGVIGDSALDEFSARVVDRKIESLQRRGKFLITRLGDDLNLLIHLRMTGSLLHVHRDAAPERFQHLTLELDDDSDLRFSDQRKFGRVLLAEKPVVEALNLRLGPEPLADSFSTQLLIARLKNRSGPIKNILLNQEVVAGLGNIYVDEALFRARIHPVRPANSLSEEETKRLHRSIRTVLREALQNRGTSFSSFRDSYGESGSNQHSLQVYGRGGTEAPCLRCGGPLIKITVGGRGTHFCPRCQT